jgi:taste receptor protein TAS2R
MLLMTIAILLGIATAAGLTVAKIREWLRHNRMAEADLIKTSLANGNFSIVAIGFDKYGYEVGRERWETRSLDRSLNAQFGGSDRAYIRV